MPKERYDMQQKVAIGRGKSVQHALHIIAFEGVFVLSYNATKPMTIVMKNDSGHIQGIPDITILYKDRWAALECKKNEGASKRPNQSYYIDKMNEMSFARFIFPENKEEVLNELEQALSTGR